MLTITKNILIKYFIKYIVKRNIRFKLIIVKVFEINDNVKRFN